MKQSIYCLVLLALLGLVIAAPATAGPKVVVYFDMDGTQRSMDSPGMGQISMVYIFGEGFPAAFVSGIQYKIDYGPSLTWIGDIAVPGASLGNSKDGIAIGFGAYPQPGNKFLIHRAWVKWDVECAAGLNVDGPISVGHPDPALGGDIRATRFPDFAVILGDGARSQTCQLVELNIRPGSCPNPLNVKLWEFLASGANAKKGGVLPVAILGSSTVDVTEIDLSSLLLEGVAPSTPPKIRDIATLDGDDDCLTCNELAGDGWDDIVLKFKAQEIAAAMGPLPEIGKDKTLTLTGTYLDGMPFEGVDCVKIVGNVNPKTVQISDSDLGFPNPNPFNPVTRISYAVPGTQHVRLAIFDVAGRLVDELVNEVKGAGEYVVEWDAGTLPSGVYFYRLETGGETLVRRATLLK